MNTRGRSRTDVYDGAVEVHWIHIIAPQYTGTLVLASGAACAEEPIKPGMLEDRSGKHAIQPAAGRHIFTQRGLIRS